MKERVLWLIRKDSVFHSDATELIRLGYDVFSGRKVTWENRTNSYFSPLKDKEAISIDKDTFDCLITLDFVHSLTDEQWKLINQTLHYVFIDYTIYIFYYSISQGCILRAGRKAGIKEEQR